MERTSYDCPVTTRAALLCNLESLLNSISQIRNEHVETRKKDYPHLQGLWFSDVCKTKNVLEIELLIGADYLWLFQEGRTVRGKSDEPVAVQTKLG